MPLNSMKKEDLKTSALPHEPGVYLFKKGKEILYIGRATDLANRIASYFSINLEGARSPLVLKAIEYATGVEHIVTTSVLESIVLEAHLIKKYSPKHNTREKDNKSFQFVIVTKEEYPRVLVVRGRDLEMLKEKPLYQFGPFPKGGDLNRAMKVIRKLFPFRDTCAVPKKGDEGTLCFRAQLGLCPGVCTGEIEKGVYKKRIREIKLFFEGNKKRIISDLKKQMKEYAKEKEFEKADMVKRRIATLTYIQEAQLIRSDYIEGKKSSFRIEGYDVAHTHGEYTVGAMVVIVDGEQNKKEYRSFNIRNAPAGDDLRALREIISRRLDHTEWEYPHLIVVDGSHNHIRVAEEELAEHGIRIPVVGVVKNERHAAREIFGDTTSARIHERPILFANSEAHRVALSRHRKRRSVPFRKK